MWGVETRELERLQSIFRITLAEIPTKLKKQVGLDYSRLGHGFLLPQLCCLQSCFVSCATMVVCSVSV